MKSLNSNELVSLCEWIRKCLEGAQLQDLWTDGACVVLHFYRGQDWYLFLDLAPSAPLLVLWERKPPIRKKPKPLTLFLASHGRNLFFADVLVDLQVGRRVELKLGNLDRECFLEFDLIPKWVNLTVRADGKIVSWNKPRDLPAPGVVEFEKIQRDWFLWCQQIWNYKFQAHQKMGDLEQAQEKQGRALEKKLKALNQLRAQMDSDLADQWRELGQRLKMGEGQSHPLWIELDNKRPISERIESCFEQAKNIERKQAGTLKRISQLETEISELQRSKDSPQALASKSVAKARLLKKEPDLETRKLELTDGATAYFGKSAGDNLQLLRQAKAWDLWVHLKDEPSAHAVIFRQRNQVVSRDSIQKVAEWIWRQKRKSMAEWGRFDVVVVECRFVRPIKGDRLGRVHYQNPQVYTFASSRGS